MPSVAKRSIPGAWRLGPEHPHYGYSGNDGDYENGSMMARRFFLTPEGATVVTAAGSLADSDAGELVRQDGIPPTAASSGHLYCAPAFRHLCEGRLPAGWIRERREGVA